jgi:hypothetical protein
MLRPYDGLRDYQINFLKIMNPPLLMDNLKRTDMM